MASAASEFESLKRRLEELEKENAKLRDQKAQKVLKKEDIRAVVGDWRGHPVLKFEGPFKPFTLGLKKSWIVLQKLDDMRAFVEQNKQKLATASDSV